MGSGIDNFNTPKQNKAEVEHNGLSQNLTLYEHDKFSYSKK
ncbi:hypothetical protein ADU37_CDS11590 [Thermococcus sp. 2319x1]|nr:hypothetical protein ADU37_CDS11590 [Thermococcus sp. 2319x1]